ncbi:hypothetical protein C8Q73DRAFT_311981 [Cubamyces lactineus]|nr:hypothetical protein C8Q73DRAFT_311981 [Cubamyces lactineus]
MKGTPGPRFPSSSSLSSINVLSPSSHAYVHTHTRSGSKLRAQAPLVLFSFHFTYVAHAGPANRPRGPCARILPSWHSQAFLAAPQPPSTHQQRPTGGPRSPAHPFRLLFVQKKPWPSLSPVCPSTQSNDTPGRMISSTAVPEQPQEGRQNTRHTLSQLTDNRVLKLQRLHAFPSPASSFSPVLDRCLSLRSSNSRPSGLAPRSTCLVWQVFGDGAPGSVSPPAINPISRWINLRSHAFLILVLGFFI